MGEWFDGGVIEEKSLVIGKEVKNVIVKPSGRCNWNVEPDKCTDFFL